MDAASDIILFSAYVYYIARRLNEAPTQLKDVSLRSNFFAEI